MAHKCEVDTYFKDMNWYQKLRLISPDNPRSLGHFRSIICLKNEQERHQELSRCTIHPFSKFRAWYEMYLIYLYGSLLITKSVDAAFVSYEISQKAPFYTYYIILTDVLTWIDIGMSFFIGYDINKKKTIELRLHYTAAKYLKSPYFICDIMSSVPKTLLYKVPPLGWRNHLYGIISIMALLKIVRLVSLVVYIWNTSNYFRVMNRAMTFIVCTVVVAYIVLHYMSCFQLTIPRCIRRAFVVDQTRRSWFYENDLLNRSLATQYIHCFFKSSAAILSIRLNLYKATYPEEYLVKIITFLVGKILIAFIWIIFAVAILNARSMHIKFAEVMNQLEEYLSQKNVPLTLRKRMLQYFNFKYRGKLFEEKVIHAMLSDTLRNDVNTHTCRSLIKNVALFREMSTDEINKIVQCLIPEIFLPLDTIIQCGTPGDAMYFLSSGTVALYSRSGKEICHLQDGAYFGEIALVLKHQARSVSIVAIETTHVYRLDQRDVKKYLLINKKVMQKILENAEIKLKEVAHIEETYRKLMFEQTYKI